MRKKTPRSAAKSPRTAMASVTNHVAESRAALERMKADIEANGLSPEWKRTRYASPGEPSPINSGIPRVDVPPDFDPHGVTWATLLGADSLKDAIREAAIKALLDHWFATPIPGPRWKVLKGRILSELDGRARDHKRTRNEELKACVYPALYLIGNIFDAHLAGKLRSQVAEIVLRDVLGLDYRHRQPQDIDALADILGDDSLPDVIEVIAVDEIRAKVKGEWKVKLTDDDLHFYALLSTSGSVAEAGRRMGRSEQAAWKRYQRLEAKLKKLLGKPSTADR